MACYIVSFEPIGIGAADKIRAQLKTLGQYCPVNAYAWAVISQMNAVQLADYVKQVAPLSRIFVLRSGTEGAWVNAYGEQNSQWLKNNL